MIKLLNILILVKFDKMMKFIDDIQNHDLRLLNIIKNTSKQLDDNFWEQIFQRGYWHLFKSPYQNDVFIAYLHFAISARHGNSLA